MANAWERRKGESAKAYTYFQVYLRMAPVDRSLGKVGAELGRSTAIMEYFAAKWDWVERVDAWDRHQDALNFERFERQREKAARKRMERELARQDEAEQVADLLLQRAQAMLKWPIEQEVITDKTTEITPDGQTLNITTHKTIKPVKWSMIAAMRVIEALDRMRHASVEDAVASKEPAGIPPQEIAERHFTLHTADQVQMPKAPDTSMDEAPKDGDWTVDEGGEALPPGTQPEAKPLF